MLNPIEFCMSFAGVPTEEVNRSFHWNSLTKRQITAFLFDYCFDCLVTGTMSAVLQGSFAARKVHEREMMIAKMQAHDQDRPQMYPESKLTELSPLKYNSKLMNSIWGLYNRYSVHNFKQNTDADSQMLMGEQQRDAVVSPNSEAATSIFSKAVDALWPNISHY